MALSTLVAAGGILLAWRMYIAKPFTKERASHSAGGFHRLLVQKYYVDEIYDALIVQPLKRFANFLWDVFDSLILDGLVNLTGMIVKAVSWIVSRVQTGKTPVYATSMVVGAVVMLYYIIR